MTPDIYQLSGFQIEGHAHSFEAEAVASESQKLYDTALIPAARFIIGFLQSCRHCLRFEPPSAASLTDFE